jgi:Bacterial extracellular solute-binding protein
MAINRRAFGLGLLGLSVVGTGAVLYGRDSPLLRGYLGEATKLFGFIGGEKEGFLADPDVVSALRHRGLELDARRAGSVEMSRERAILDQNPQFLWPSSNGFVDLARENGVKVQRDQVILNSPMVIYSWDTIARGLVSSGFAQPDGDDRYRLDLAKLLDAILGKKSWANLGVPNLFGQARLLSTDPNRSNSGFMFAGLAANVLAGEVATEQSLTRIGGAVGTIFARMGYKPSSSGKMFEDYLAGGPGAQPLVIGYENQLVEWVLQDEERWKRLEAAAPAKPVIIYPAPTVFSAHPLIVVDNAAAPLVDALMSPEVQQIAWNKHGFRGPLGLSGETQNPLVSSRIMARVDAVLPMPDIKTMLTLIGQLAA